MVSFFEKLKKGMGIEKPAEEVEEVEEKPARKKRVLKTPKESPEAERARYEAGKLPTRPAEIKIEKVPVEKAVEKKPSFAKATEDKEKWPEPEGQLAIDVYQTETELVIQSAIAGVKPEDLDISMEKDIINIKGNRQKPFEEEGDYFTQECYWGPFFREVILPVEVDPNQTEAIIKEGILTIRIPKLLREKRRRIKVRI